MAITEGGMDGCGACEAVASNVCFVRSFRPTVISSSRDEVAVGDSKLSNWVIGDGTLAAESFRCTRIKGKFNLLILFGMWL